MMHALLEFTVPEGAQPQEIIERVAVEVLDGIESGTMSDQHWQDDAEWRFTPNSEGASIDRRQRVAAAHLLMAFDLPRDMEEAARAMLEASRVCDGLTTRDIGDMGEHNRLRHLQRAYDLIGNMIAEEGKAASGSLTE